MAYKITDECWRCEECYWACGNEAIFRGETIFMIDPDRCTECVGDFESPQCAAVCPVDCCIPDPDHKESQEQLLEKWKRLHPGETPAIA